MIHSNNKINFLGNNYIKSKKDKTDKKNEIDELVKNISKTSGFNEFCDVVDKYIEDNPSATVINENFIKNGEYYIQLGLTDDITQMKNVLTYLNKNNFSISPDEVIDVSNKHGFSALIVKFDSAEDSNLRPYNKKSTQILKSSKDKAYSDMMKLTDFGFVNMNLLEDENTLKVIKPKERIICEDWSYLVPVKEYLENSDDESRADLLQKLHSIIY